MKLRSLGILDTPNIPTGAITKLKRMQDRKDPTWPCWRIATCVALQSSSALS